MRKEILMIPGPTPVPPEVVAAMAKPMIGHRSDEFSSLFRRIHGYLQKVFRTEQDVLTFPAAGTGAMEAVLVNLFSPGHRILVAQTGEFGFRFGKMARAFGLDVTVVKFEPGEGLDPDRMIQCLEEGGGNHYQGVLVTHNETSTGVCNDLQNLGHWCRQHHTLMVVDAVSSLGALPLKMDEWGLDAVVSASQKALMTPPGLAFAALSPRAWERSKEAALPRVYWDFAAARASLHKGQTPYTPAISLLFGLEQALEMILSEGLESRWEHHRVGGKAMRAGIASLGLSMVARPQDASDTVTAIWIPEPHDANGVQEQMAIEYGVSVAGGQGNLAGKIIRIGHMGYTSWDDIRTTIYALESVLGGRPSKEQKACRAVDQVLKDKGVMDR